MSYSANKNVLNSCKNNVMKTVEKRLFIDSNVEKS